MRPVEELAELLESERYGHKTLADGSGVLLDMAGMRIMSLNRTGMFILEAILEGVVRIDLLERRLTEAFEVDDRTASRDLIGLLEELDHLLLTEAQEP